MRGVVNGLSVADVIARVGWLETERVANAFGSVDVKVHVKGFRCVCGSLALVLQGTRPDHDGWDQADRKDPKDGQIQPNVLSKVAQNRSCDEDSEHGHKECNGTSNSFRHFFSG